MWIDGRRDDRLTTSARIDLTSFNPRLSILLSRPYLHPSISTGRHGSSVTRKILETNGFSCSFALHCNDYLSSTGTLIAYTLPLPFGDTDLIQVQVAD
jgi:hypothetical protein